MSGKATLILIAMGISGFAFMAVSIFDVPPRLLYNPSPSAPTGFYEVDDLVAFKVGDLVAARLPKAMRSFVVERGYLRKNVPVVKRIVAMQGDHVCFRDGAIHLNSDHLVESLKADFLERPMPVWKGCRVLKEDELFLAMTDVPTSLDSRYFGPVNRSDILGRVHPVAFLGSGWNPGFPDVQGADMAPGNQSGRKAR